MKIEGDAKLIAAAFVKARGAMNATVSKDAKGNYGKYATLAAIVEATAEHLAKQGLAIVQEASMFEGGIVIETWLVHESGATMQFSPLTMPLTDRKPQAVGSAITYGRRYALAAVCGLAPDDDDGQAAQDAQTRQESRNGGQQGQRANGQRSTQRRAPVAAESGDEVFETETATRASKAQLDAIAKLGPQAYPNEWDEENQHKLAQWASQGARGKLEELFEMEAAKLVKALERKLAA